MYEGWEDMPPPTSPHLYETGFVDLSPGWRERYENMPELEVRQILNPILDTTGLKPPRVPSLKTIDPKITTHGMPHGEHSRGNCPGSLLLGSSARTGSNDLQKYSLASPGLRSATAESRKLLAENQKLKDDLQDMKQKYEKLQRGCDQLQKMLSAYEKARNEESENGNSDSDDAPHKTTNRRRENIEARAKMVAQYRKSFSGAFEFERQWTSSQTGFTFHYNEHHELDSHMKFRSEQVLDYIQNHIHFTTYADILFGGTRSNALTIWIQNHPADSSARYPHKLSSKCRFESCPNPNNTINKGEYRVCFDEWDWAGDDDKDPFHNAGYAHLFCLEEQIDFPWLCKVYNVRGDDRHFRKETSNKMAITRDYRQMLNLVNDYISDSQQWPAPRPADWYEDSLCKMLTDYHLDHQPRGRQDVRNSRAGISLDRYHGDLRLKQQMVEDSKNEKFQEGGNLPVTRSRSFSMPKPVVNAKKRKGYTEVRMSGGGERAPKMSKKERKDAENHHYYTSERQEEQNSLFERHRLGNIDKSLV